MITTETLVCGVILAATVIAMPNVRAQSTPASPLPSESAAPPIPEKSDEEAQKMRRHGLSEDHAAKAEAIAKDQSLSREVRTSHLLSLREKEIAEIPGQRVLQPANEVTDESKGSQSAIPASTLGDIPYGRQTKRILYIVPNFNAISAGAHLPPQTAKDKFLDATQDTFDYSNWVFIGIVAGIGQAQTSTQEFHQGAVGYGRYYWHAFVDQADENYFVESFMPIVLRQDTRYYTLGRGGFLHRTFYAFSRAAVTRSNSGRPEPNYSEVVGAGASAGISTLYYPDAERTWTKTGQRWTLNVGLDMMTLVFKEFWPDINHKVLRQK
jgi:hypothetical protein